MKQLIIKQGKTVVEEVPAPQVGKGKILVEVKKSCISNGTEISGVKMSGMPLWKRALKQPQNVKKVVSMAASYGIAKTKKVIQGRLAAGNPTGYSLSGVVIEVGEGVTEFKVGDNVACAGAECAHHAEVVSVPINLSVKMPKNIDFSDAATVTLGAIAMQGVRRANPTLGEIFVVVGMGVLGQITSQLLKANGCRVVATDLDESRLEKARELGADYVCSPSTDNALEETKLLTDGNGVDGVIITAASASDQILANAFKMCRKKARVVVVGDVGLKIDRSDIYKKELDFFISTSYGPGRYDKSYEDDGKEYPISYVRWTENRNMQEYLNLIADKKLNIQKLVSKIYSIDDATEAYQQIASAEVKPLVVLLDYPKDENNNILNRIIQNPKATTVNKDKIQVGIAGAGGFAKAVHLPNLEKMHKDCEIRAIMSGSGHNSHSTAMQQSAAYSTTDFDEMLKDELLDLVVVTTQHDLHAELTLKALKAGKHVLVEKPICLTAEELTQIAEYFAENEKTPLLLTGYNRRFSPYLKTIKEITDKRKKPLMINYRMNAGFIPHDHWTQTAAGGGRNLGEGCHIYDVFTYLTGSKVVNINAQAVNSDNYYYANENFVATMTFEDDSVATLTYTAAGSRDYPKETMDVFFDGKVLHMDDYKKLECYGVKKSLTTSVPEKGHTEELQQFVSAIKNNLEWPIDLWQQLQAAEIALEVEKQLNGGK